MGGFRARAHGFHLTAPLGGTWLGFVLVPLLVGGCELLPECAEEDCSEAVPDDRHTCADATVVPADTCSPAIAQSMDAARSRVARFGFRGDRVEDVEAGTVTTLQDNELQIDLGDRAVSFTWPASEIPLPLMVGDAVEIESIEGWAVVRGEAGELRVPVEPGEFSFDPGPWPLGDELQLRQIEGSCWSGGAREVVLEVRSDRSAVELHPGESLVLRGWTVENAGSGASPAKHACGTVSEGRHFGGFSVWRAG